MKNLFDYFRPFFRRLEDSQVRTDFHKAVDDFVSKIKGRAIEKHKENEETRMQEQQQEEYVELSKEERIGPGGLDPVEVFESLPKDLQECFESENIPKLK